MPALLAQNGTTAHGQFSPVSSLSPARHSWVVSANSTPSHHRTSQHGQFATGSQRESQAGRRVSSWAKCRAAAVAKDFPPEGEPGGQASDWVDWVQNRDFPFSHTLPMSMRQAPNHLEFGLFSRGSIVQCWQWVGEVVENLIAATITMPSSGSVPWARHGGSSGDGVCERMGSSWPPLPLFCALLTCSLIHPPTGSPSSCLQ